MKRFKNFTDKEVYMIQRAFTEASFEIAMTDKYTDDQVKLFNDLYNEIIEEDKKRIYKDDYEKEKKMTNKKELKNIDESEEKSFDELTYEKALDILLSQVDLVESEENIMCKDALKEAIERLRKYENNKIIDDNGKDGEAIITGTARKSTEPPITYPICPHCNGHHTKQLYGTATCASENNGYRNNLCLHYKCLDCGVEFDKEFKDETIVDLN